MCSGETLPRTPSGRPLLGRIEFSRHACSKVFCKVVKKQIRACLRGCFRSSVPCQLIQSKYASPNGPQSPLVLSRPRIRARKRRASRNKSSRCVKFIRSIEQKSKYAGRLAMLPKGGDLKYCQAIGPPISKPCTLACTTYQLQFIYHSRRREKPSFTHHQVLGRFVPLQ